MVYVPKEFTELTYWNACFARSKVDDRASLYFFNNVTNPNNFKEEKTISVRVRSAAAR